ncbi:P-loop containing nucleoside triphosphate hydrolase protein [Massarina eburnea CBS 473.64]|uniref:P-loop containing nucleoside triphosphate hydrolase protein n=1 Tax=Massarina eburnea CBS 473.64 TaxID=1395130 RepID=A0A6A6SBH9_9PLEO|nr:P-loop containing nucleoside triphosphate hydrolase protein [Massarina eburnea CBS 473.64]
MAASPDDFTFVDVEGDGGRGGGPPQLFPEYQQMTSNKVADLDVQITTALREKYPELIVTTVPASNVDFLQFAAAGFALAKLEEDAEPVLRWRGFIGPAHRGGTGYLADATFFARYRYAWNDEHFILYIVQLGLTTLQYILKEPVGNETTASHSSVVDHLISKIGAWLTRDTELPAIYVYDQYWTRSTKLWEEVKKARWEDVILDPKKKKALTEVANKFFDNEEIYKEYGVPWKRGLIFHGPVGNGKTISLKALMHTLQQRKTPVVTLYVKNAPYAYNIRAVFTMARAMTPCLLVLEDIDTIVTKASRSYFFNEVDGLENNDGILMIATTNHLDELDPGLSKRPSRFDRKYLFPLPDKGERSQYAQYWRHKLEGKKDIDFPSKLCDAIADITDDFSFAYLKEAFVATLLELARNHDGDDDDDEDEEEKLSTLDHEKDDDDDDDDPLNKYLFWRTIKAMVKSLRSDMSDDKPPKDGNDNDTKPEPRHFRTAYNKGFSAAYEDMLPLMEKMSLQHQHQKVTTTKNAPATRLPDRKFSSGPFSGTGFGALDPVDGSVSGSGPGPAGIAEESAENVLGYIRSLQPVGRGLSGFDDEVMGRPADLR